MKLMLTAALLACISSTSALPRGSKRKYSFRGTDAEHGRQLMHHKSGKKHGKLYHDGTDMCVGVDETPGGDFEAEFVDCNLAPHDIPKFKYHDRYQTIKAEHKNKPYDMYCLTALNDVSLQACDGTDDQKWIREDHVLGDYRFKNVEAESAGTDEWLDGDAGGLELDGKMENCDCQQWKLI